MLLNVAAMLRQRHADLFDGAQRNKHMVSSQRPQAIQALGQHPAYA